MRALLAAFLMCCSCASAPAPKPQIREWTGTKLVRPGEYVLHIVTNGATDKDYAALCVIVAPWDGSYEPCARGELVGMCSDHFRVPTPTCAAAH